MISFGVEMGKMWTPWDNEVSEHFENLGVRTLYLEEVNFKILKNNINSLPISNMISFGEGMRKTWIPWNNDNSAHFEILGVYILYLKEVIFEILKKNITSSTISNMISFRVMDKGTQGRLTNS